MGDTTVQLVETHLNVVDRAAGPLKRIADQADKTASSLQKASHAASHGGSAAGGAFGQLFQTLQSMAGIGGVVGAALSLHSAIESTEKYMSNLKEVSELTGATVGQTDFLLSSARRAGVEYSTMANTMFQLSKRGSMLATTQESMAGKVPGMAKRFESLGVNLKKGPVASLEAMSAAVKAGKIGAGELMAQFRIPQKAANDMEEFLSNLDSKKLAAIKKGGGGFMDEGTMSAFKAIEAAQHRINDTWNRIKVTIVTKLYPVVADMAEKFASRLESVLPKIEDAMQFVADHMDQIVAAAKTFAAVMTGKKLLDMATQLASPGGIVGKLGSMGLAALSSGGGSALAGIASQLAVVKAGFVAAAPALAAIAAAVAIAYLAFQAFQKNIHGIGDKLRLVWDTITARFELMWGTLSGIGDAIAKMFGEGNGGLGDLIGYYAALSFDKALEAFDLVIHSIQTVLSMGGELADMFQFIWKDVLHDMWIEYVQEPFITSMKFIAEGVGKVVDFLVAQYNTISKFWGGQGMSASAAKLDFGWLEAPMKMFKKHWERTNVATEQQVRMDRRRVAARRETPSEREEKRFDFRGSRFDITQQFAEGFDPDRIAVAFSNDLASMGEMRTQSSLDQVFAVR